MGTTRLHLTASAILLAAASVLACTPSTAVADGPGYSPGHARARHNVRSVQRRPVVVRQVVRRRPIYRTYAYPCAPSYGFSLGYYGGSRFRFGFSYGVPAYGYRYPGPYYRSPYGYCR